MSFKIQVDYTREPPSLVSSYASEIASIKACLDNKFEMMKELIHTERSLMKACIREAVDEVFNREGGGNVQDIVRSVVKEVFLEFLGGSPAAANGEPPISFCVM